MSFSADYYVKCNMCFLNGCGFKHSCCKFTWADVYMVCCRVKTECGGTRAETRFGLSAKWTSPFLSAGVSVQSAAGSRSMRIGGSNAG